MLNSKKSFNLALSGGGVKGIAYAGVFALAEERGFKWGNIAGVSAGALVGTLSSAEYNAREIWNILDKFDFDKIKIDEIPKKVPVVSSYIEYLSSSQTNPKSYEDFLGQVNSDRSFNPPFVGFRGNILKNIITFSKDGCLYDGDYFEEWISKVLAKRGIRNFGSLRGGFIDKSNPNGYKIRMTAVDANRGKIIVLPDDLDYYGIDPDKFEVAKAVRMSTSVPFAFKPVELKKNSGNSSDIYYIVDGGVFDNFPCWLVSSSTNLPSMGFRLDGGEKKKLFSVDTYLAIIKGLISAVHDIGLPKHKNKCTLETVIDTQKVSYLDFNITEEEKAYLFKEGKQAANTLLPKVELKYSIGGNRLKSFLSKKIKYFRKK